MTSIQPITYLQVPSKKNEPVIKPDSAINVGQPYYVQAKTHLAKAPQGLIAAYHFSSDSAEIIPFSLGSSDLQTGVIWDSEAQVQTDALCFSKTKTGQSYAGTEIQLHQNNLILKDVNLSGPDIIETSRGASLSVTTQFELSFNTKEFAAQLGVIHLVQAQRFVVLENGEQVFLFDSGDDESVLYLEHQDQTSPLAWQSPEQAGQLKETHHFSVGATQLIPEHLLGHRVVNVTVLEKYSSFIMQRSVCDHQEPATWIPVHVPINWGWSVRAGCRGDGEWAIMRRKVMLPTNDDSGLQYPLWQANNLSLTCNPLSE